MESVFKFKNNFKFKLSGWYNAPTQSVLFEESGNGSLNTSISKSFFDKQLMISITYNDILNTQQLTSSVDFGEMRINIFKTWESQRVIVNARYAFGNSKLKKQSKRKSASSVEQNRIK